MKLKLYDILVALVFALLLIETCINLNGIKSGPQLILLLFGGVTLTAIIIKQNVLSRTLFYIILGLIFYINYFELINWIMGFIDPNRGWALDNNEVRLGKVMDMTWIWGLLLGLILSPLTVLLYHKVIHKNRTVEILVTIAFTGIIAIAYIREALL
jgi:hypothetical protein